MKTLTDNVLKAARAVLTCPNNIEEVHKALEALKASVALFDAPLTGTSLLISYVEAKQVVAELALAIAMDIRAERKKLGLAAKSDTIEDYLL